MRPRTRFVFLIAALLFLVASTYYVVVIYIPSLQPAAIGALGAASADETALHTEQNNARFITLVAVMLGGIVASYIFEITKKSKSTINIFRELAKMLTSSRFIMAIVVSPLIFNSIYLIVGDNPQSIGDYLLAFQNGFFWETVMVGLSRGR